MSIASPTRRSSSSTVPGPSFNNSLTSILERPSTAETCTGTSNTASRSAARRAAYCGFEVGGGLLCIFVLVVADVGAGGRQRAVEIGQRDLSVGVAHGS